MRKIEDLENYLGQLLNTTKVDRAILYEISNIKLLLYVYRLGLQKEDFTSDTLLRNFLLEDIPEHFHTLLGQMSIIKAKSVDGGTLDYCIRNCNTILKEYKIYFNEKKIKEQKCEKCCMGGCGNVNCKHC